MFYLLDQYSLNISNIPNEAKDENTVGLLQKVEGVSAILHGDGNQEACKQSEQKLDVYVAHTCCWEIILGMYFALRLLHVKVVDDLVLLRFVNAHA